MTHDQKRLLWTLALINFFNYVDRQVVFPLFPLIKDEFSVSDFELGLLGTVFMLVHSLASLPLGYLADRVHRPRLIAAGVFFWSITTLFCGLAPGFVMLLVLRALVGIGEASYAPAAAALISDNFGRETRSRAQGVFNIGMFVGGTLGIALGGIIANAAGGWREAFFIVPIPGFILAMLALRMPDKVHHRHEPHVPLKSLLKNHAWLWVLVAGTLVTFATGAIITWGVEFVRRYLAMDIQTSSLMLGGTLVVSGIIGVVAGSWLADRLATRHSWGRAAVLAGTLTLAGPILFGGIQAGWEGPWFVGLDGTLFADFVSGMGTAGILFFASAFLAGALMSAYHGPLTALIHEIVPPRMRASAFAAYVLVIHLIGDTLSPAAVGWVSDLASLKTGLEFVTIAITASGLAFVVVARLVQRGRTGLVRDPG
ncbi:MAG TPA: MFS transporter [Spirochaetota bacterium]|nr:MFS transporter [Spirochaetota bacterium]